MSRISLFALGLIASSAAYAQAPQEPKTSLRTDVQKQVDRTFDQADVNNDGFLSRNETNAMASKSAQPVIERMEKEFAAMDKDKNGQLSLAEFKAAANSRLAGQAVVGADRLDTNKDGKISPAEFRTPILSTFDRADTNKDGKLTAEEAKKAQGRR